MEYFDTSVLVAFYCPEPQSIAAEKALLQSSRPNVSKLNELEFASALSLKIRTGQFDIATARAAQIQFQNHLAAGLYDFLPIDLRNFELARDWIAQFSTALRTLDALHLAIAHLSRCELVTADQSLEKSAAVLGVQCRLIG